MSRLATTTNALGRASYQETDPIMLDDTAPITPFMQTACSDSGATAVYDAGLPTTWYQADTSALNLCWPPGDELVDPESGIASITAKVSRWGIPTGGSNMKWGLQDGLWGSMSGGGWYSC